MNLELKTIPLVIVPDPYLFELVGRMGGKGHRLYPIKITDFGCTRRERRLFSSRAAFSSRVGTAYFGEQGQTLPDYVCCTAAVPQTFSISAPAVCELNIHSCLIKQARPL